MGIPTSYKPLDLMLQVPQVHTMGAEKKRKWSPGAEVENHGMKGEMDGYPAKILSRIL